ncbi:hypothetical protein [Fastidiosibacter lacustris]|uniref:hypothetical protein n=1 Tax=Fastidiosibacter lacustris TaxID=2056695 RepID=UPI000E349FD2|nr:hypothetical protein [Fastidiosibacter lacustris]
MEKIRIFAVYFVYYTVIGALSAWIPLTWFGLYFGLPSILIAAIVLSVLRIFELGSTCASLRLVFSVNRFSIAVLVLFVVDCLYTIWVIYI